MSHPTHYMQCKLYCAMLCRVTVSTHYHSYHPSLSHQNYGDNDPHWSRAFTKLSQLIEHHPSAILFDSGTVDPTADSGNLEGKRDVTIPMETSVLDRAVRQGAEAVSAAVTLADAGGAAAGAAGGGE